MPTLVLEDVPSEVYQRLEKMAAASDRPVAEEALLQLRRLVQDSPFSMEPAPASCDLPLAGDGVQVKAKEVPAWLPDPPFLTEEIPAPFTLPLPGKGMPVTARPGGKFLPEPHDLPDEQP